MTDRSPATTTRSPLLYVFLTLCVGVAAYSVIVMVDAVRGIHDARAAVAALKDCSARHMRAERAGRSFVCIDDSEWWALLEYVETGKTR